jgi:hypothetical protein
LITGGVGFIAGGPEITTHHPPHHPPHPNAKPADEARTCVAVSGVESSS